jgi:hypothetical protein
MHHQVQQFSDIRLKSLALTRCVRHCHVAFLPVGIAFQEFGGPSRLAPNLAPPSPRSADIAFAPGGCKTFALSVFYSEKVQEFGAVFAKPRAGEAGIDAVFTVEPKERTSYALIKEICTKISISRTHM